MIDWHGNFNGLILFTIIIISFLSLMELTSFSNIWSLSIFILYKIRSDEFLHDTAIFFTFQIFSFSSPRFIIFAFKFSILSDVYFYFPYWIIHLFYGCFYFFFSVLLFCCAYLKKKTILAILTLSWMLMKFFICCFALFFFDQGNIIWPLLLIIPDHAENTGSSLPKYAALNPVST